MANGALKPATGHLLRAPCVLDALHSFSGVEASGSTPNATHPVQYGACLTMRGI